MSKCFAVTAELFDKIQFTSFILNCTCYDIHLCFGVPWAFVIDTELSAHTNVTLNLTSNVSSNPDHSATLCHISSAIHMIMIIFIYVRQCLENAPSLESKTYLL